MKLHIHILSNSLLTGHPVI